MKYQDKARGMLVGLAVGDALGAPVEFGYSSDFIKKLGEELEYFHDTPRCQSGVWTDDTEMALWEIRQRFNVGSFYAERLIRTETNHFENETEFIAYQEMGIDQYVFVATLDGRTSDMCRSHDGQIYKMSERQEGYNYPPLHPFCRSTVRGYIGKDYEPKMRSARNKLGGKYFVPNMSYNEWIKDVQFNPNVYPVDVPTIMP